MNSNTFYTSKIPIFKTPLIIIIVGWLWSILDYFGFSTNVIILLNLTFVIVANFLLQVKIIFSMEGIIKSSVLENTFMSWEDIKTIGGFYYPRKNELRSMDFDQLEEVVFEDEAIYFPAQKFIYLSKQQNYNLEQLPPSSQDFIYFKNTPEILEEIQKWLLILNKNV